MQFLMSVWTMDRAWTTETLATTGLVHWSIWSTLFQNFPEIRVGMRVLPPARSHRQKKFSKNHAGPGPCGPVDYRPVPLPLRWAWCAPNSSNTDQRLGAERLAFLQE